MSDAVRTVAAWEFRRWFKWRDQFVTILIGVFSACVMGFVAGRVGDEAETITIGVIGSMDELPESDRFTFVSLEGEDHGYARAVPTADDRDGVLERKPGEPPKLWSDSEQLWNADLIRLFEAARLEETLSELELDAEQSSRLLTPLSFETQFDRDPGERTRQLVTAFLVIGVVLLAVFLGMAYQFVAITGEKQARVTELMLSAVTPQQWIDGKILGLTGFSVVNLATYGVSAIAFLQVGELWGVHLPVDLSLVGTTGLGWSLVFGLGGFWLWNTFFAAIAATISDPNTSTRSGLLILPLLPAGLAALALQDPDAFWVQVCTLLPPTSWAFAPIRLVVTDVPLWELLVALALLFASAYGLRTAAGRIFHASILMTGRDPSWKEVLGFARARS